MNETLFSINVTPMLIVFLTACGIAGNVIGNLIADKIKSMRRKDKWHIGEYTSTPGSRIR